MSTPVHTAPRAAPPAAPDVAPCPGGWLALISADIGAVLDPLAARYAGWPVPAIRLALTRAWFEAFGAELGEPGLTDTAAAIRDGRPWAHGLWTDGW